MRFAALFLWILVPLGLWLVVAQFGTPHGIVSYRYIGSAYRPVSERRYTQCSYLGWIGVVTVPATDGRCPWVRLFKEGS